MSAGTLDYIKFFVAIVSLLFAIYQYTRNRRIKYLISLEAIEVHNNTAVALGAIQAAKQDVIAGRNPSFEIGRAEGINQAILAESAKVFCNLRNTNLSTVDELINNGQLKAQYKEIYYGFSKKTRRKIKGAS